MHLSQPLDSLALEPRPRRVEGIGSYIRSIPTGQGQSVLQARRFDLQPGLCVGFFNHNLLLFSKVASKPKSNTHVYS